MGARRASGGTGRASRLAQPMGDAAVAAVAGGSRGDAAVLVARCVACPRTDLRLAVRRPGRRFSKLVRVTGHAVVPDEFGGGLPPILAIGPSGDVVVVWTTPPAAGTGAQRLMARIRRGGRWRGPPPGGGGAQRLRARIRRGGRWGGPPQGVGEARPFGRATVRIDARGRAVVAWWIRDGVSAGEETEITGPPSFFVATSTAEERFRPPRLLESGVVADGGTILPRSSRIDLELGRLGRGAIAWTGVQAGEE